MIWHSFYINVLSSRHSVNHVEAVPVVWSTDDYHIDILVFKHLAVVLVLGRTLATDFEYIFGTLV